MLYTLKKNQTKGNNINMSNIEIEKQISKVENELTKEFSQYTERKLHNMLISLRIKLNEINVVSA